jgi:type II secretory pathway pseudopilin PulG
MTLLEVTIAMAVMSTAIISVFGLFITSERFGIIAREESLALYAAEEVINEIRSKPFTVSVPDTDPNTRETVAEFHHACFPVNLVGAVVPAQRLGVASAPIIDAGLSPDGLKVEQELGVVVVNEESPCEGHFGDVDGDGDQDFPVDLDLNGKFNDTLDQAYRDAAFASGGVKLAFPVDLGGDVNLANETITRDLLRLVPLAVVVRWTSVAGLERRVQVLTFITDREGAY